jgi:S1-C subfamily serine protease
MMVLDGRGSRLGVTVSDVEAADAKAAPPGGARIEEVDSGSPAEKAGLKAGDIVVEFDGERVRSARQFTRLVQETPGGRTVTLTVMRGGQRQSLQATPEGRPFSWSFDIDGDRIRRDVERGLREWERGLRDFRLDLPSFGFRYDGPALGRRGRLGVSVEGLTPQLAEYFGAKDGGVLVTSVTEASAGAKAGLRAGDVITSVNGTRVRDANALVRELDGAGGEVTIGLLRDRKELTLKATLEPRAGGPLKSRRVYLSRVAD